MASANGSLFPGYARGFRTPLSSRLSTHYSGSETTMPREPDQTELIANRPHSAFQDEGAQQCECNNNNIEGEQERNRPNKKHLSVSSKLSD